MKKRTTFFVVLLAAACAHSDASAQQTSAVSTETAASAVSLIRVTGLSPALDPAVSRAAPELAAASIAEMRTLDLDAVSATGSRTQFKLWCLALFFGGAGIYWIGDQTGVDFIASTGGFIAVIGLLGVIMPTF